MAATFVQLGTSWANPVHMMRRELITRLGLGVASMALMPATLAAEPSFASTSSIEGLWASLRAQVRHFDQIDLEDDQACRGHWSAVGKWEQAIVDHPDTSRRATIIKLWVALNHSDGWSSVKDNDVILRDEDYRALHHLVPDLDFDAKAIAQAILALRQEA